MEEKKGERLDGEKVLAHPTLICQHLILLSPVGCAIFRREGLLYLFTYRILFPCFLPIHPFFFLLDFGFYFSSSSSHS
jgi:hypothetical protein